jgi:hypothetical protein
MKLFLLLFVILLGSSLTGSCQSTTTDTICKSERIFRNLLTLAKQKEAQDTIIALLRSDISILEQMKSTLMAKDTTNQQIILSYKSQVGNLEQQKIILEKDIKKQKRKTKIAALSGLLLTGLTAFLLTN